MTDISTKRKRLELMQQQMQMAAMPQKRTFGQSLYENIVGSGAVDTPGERIGEAIGQFAQGGLEGLAGVGDLVTAPARSAINRIRGKGPVGLEAVSGPLSAAAQNVPFGVDAPQTTLGEYARTAGEFTAPAVAMGGPSVANIARYGVAPGLASEAAGQATEGTPIEPYARMAAGVAAPAALSAAQKAITPFAADPSRLSLAKVLEEAGVPVTAGQKVGSQGLRRVEGLTGRGQNIASQQNEALTAAALRTAGSNATRATPEVMSALSKRIGSDMDDALRVIDVIPSREAVSGMAQANQTFKELSTAATNAPMIGGVLREVTRAFRTGGNISGKTVNSWRSKISKLTTSPDTATREAAKEALSAIDGMLDDSARLSGSPEAISKLTNARSEYRNYLAIQDAVARAGEGAALGIVSPSALRGAVVRQGRSAYTTGRRGDIADLARAGEAVIKPLPTSGTAENLRAMGVPMATSGGLGAYLASRAGLPAEVGFGLGAAAPQVARGAIATPPVQSYLSNQLLSGIPQPTGSVSPLLTALGGLK